MLSADSRNSSQCQALWHRAMSAAHGWHCGQRQHVEGLSTSWPMGLLAGHPVCEDQMAVQHGCRAPVPCLHVHINGSWPTVLHLHAQIAACTCQRPSQRGNYTCHVVYNEGMDVKPRHKTRVTTLPESRSALCMEVTAKRVHLHNCAC